MGKRDFWGIPLILFFLIFSSFNEGWPEERYVVKPGDSLYSLSKTFGVPIPAIKEANGLKDHLIKPKQVLIIPTLRDDPSKSSPFETFPYEVKRGESLYQISKKMGCSIDEIKNINRLQTDLLRTGQTLLLPKRELPHEDLEELGDGLEGHQVDESKEVAGESNGKWSGPEERNLFIRVAKSFLGIPYRLGGATIRGIDCSAFVKKIYDIFNVSLPRTAKEQFHFGKKVERDELEEGDLVFFKTRGPGQPHVGIYIGNNEFVHASYRSKEVRIDRLDTLYFHSRFIKGVRVKELERNS